MTGWPPGLLQDDDRKLSRWFASRPGAKRLVDLNCEEIRKNTMNMNTTTLAPCPFCGAQAHFEVDDDRWEWVECESCGMQGNRSASLMESCKPKLAEAWNRRAPAPASGETETCKCCGEGSARIVVHRECDTCTSVYSGVAEHRLQKSLAAPPAQEAQLNPDMPVQELRLHMGELTTDEVLVARAAIRWANSQQEERVPLSDAEALAIVRSVPALVTAEEEWLWAIREVEKHHGITAAQKEPK